MALRSGREVAPARNPARRRPGPTRKREARSKRCAKPGSPPLPDAPGLELIRGEIDRDHPGAVLATSFDRAQAALVVDPERIIEVLRWLKEQPGPRSAFLPSLQAADSLPNHPRCAAHYELITRARGERIRVNAMLEAAPPAGGAGLGDRHSPNASGGGAKS